MFISDAFAQAAAGATQQSPLMSFVPLILIFAVFYFLIIRPQSKKFKEHQNMVSNLKIGNKVITNGGIFGTIKEIHEKEEQIEVEIAQDVVVKMLRSNVLELVKKEEKELSKAKKSK